MGQMVYVALATMLFMVFTLFSTVVLTMQNAFTGNRGAGQQPGAGLFWQRQRTESAVSGESYWIRPAMAEYALGISTDDFYTLVMVLVISAV